MTVYSKLLAMFVHCRVSCASGVSSCNMNFWEFENQQNALHDGNQTADGNNLRPKE